MLEVSLPCSMTGYAGSKAESLYPECWDGLVGYWDFPALGAIPVTGQAFDLSGNDNHGALVSDVHIVPDEPGPVCDFDGALDHINCGTGSSLDVGPGDFTFVAVAKITTKGGDRDIANKGANLANISIRYDVGNDAFAWSINDGGWQQVYHQMTPALDTWYHVAGVREGSVSRMYVDGVLGDTTGTIGTVANLSANIFAIGRMGSAADRYWIGQIAYVMVYNRALSGAQIGFLHAHQRALVTPLDSIIVSVPGGDVALDGSAAMVLAESATLSASRKLAASEAMTLGQTGTLRRLRRIPASAAMLLGQSGSMLRVRELAVTSAMALVATGELSVQGVVDLDGSAVMVLAESSSLKVSRKLTATAALTMTASAVLCVDEQGGGGGGFASLTKYFYARKAG